MANITTDELITLLGSKEAELHALRRDNARLAELATTLNARLAEQAPPTVAELPPGWKLVRIEG